MYGYALDTVFRIPHRNAANRLLKNIYFDPPDSSHYSLFRRTILLHRSFRPPFRDISAANQQSIPALLHLPRITRAGADDNFLAERRLHSDHIAKRIYGRSRDLSSRRLFVVSVFDIAAMSHDDVISNIKQASNPPSDL